MKTFLKRILFILILSLSIGVLVFFAFRYMDNSMIKCSEKAGNTYIFGNSHAMSSMDPDILASITGRTFTSYGSNGQSMFWAVQGIEKKIIQCPNSTILVEFTNNSLSTDWWTYDNSRMLRERDKLYQLDRAELLYLFDHNKTKTGKLLLTLPIPSTKIDGKFGKNDKVRLAEDIKEKGERIVVQYKNLEENDNPDAGYTGLTQLIRKHPATAFILVRSPMHTTYFQMLHEINNEKLYLEYLARLKLFPNVRTLDFGHLELHDSCFADMDHLNVKGAGVFSKILGDSLIVKY